MYGPSEAGRSWEKKRQRKPEEVRFQLVLYLHLWGELSYGQEDQMNLGAGAL